MKMVSNRSHYYCMSSMRCVIYTHLYAFIIVCTAQKDISKESVTLTHSCARPYTLASRNVTLLTLRCYCTSPKIASPSNPLGPLLLLLSAALSLTPTIWHSTQPTARCKSTRFTSRTRVSSRACTEAFPQNVSMWPNWRFFEEQQRSRETAFHFVCEEFHINQSKPGEWRYCF